MSKITFERNKLTVILPWQQSCAACGDDFDVGDSVYIIIMGKGNTRWTFDIACLEQFNGFVTLALLDSEAVEEPSRVN